MRPEYRAISFLLMLCAAQTIYAANPCLSGGYPQARDGSGTGGTGHGPLQEDGSGFGGTGHTPLISGSTDGTGMGGTGHAPSQEDESGIGGSGHAPWKEAGDESGMGGTGHGPTEDSSGIGGTGHDTEVEGVITGFASICVNGLELHYQPNTPVAINNRIASTKDLAIGQVVRAQAVGAGDQFAISHLQIRHLMVATLEDVSAGRAKAMGLTIMFDEDAKLPTGLGRGQKVAISGFAGPGGIIIATRIDAVPMDSPDSIIGVTGFDGQGRRTIGGVLLDGPGADLKPGMNTMAEGRFDNGRLQADRVAPDAPLSRAERLIIQGPIKESGKGRLNIDGRQLAVDPSGHGKQILPQAGQWVRVEGQRHGHELLIQKIDIQERVLPSHNRESDRSPKKGEGRTSREAEEHGRTERAERVETPETPERVESPEGVERVETPETPERIESPERAERVETPERVERNDSRERD